GRADPFTYQGQLKVNGSAPTANFDFVFSLYDSQAPGGLVIGAPTTVGNVPVTGGLFTVQLDFGLAPFDGTNRYLEIAIQPARAPVAAVLRPFLQATPSPPRLIRSIPKPARPRSCRPARSAPARPRPVRCSNGAARPGRRHPIAIRPTRRGLAFNLPARHS